MAKAEATVEELVGMIERGELRLPEMQRQYVWKKTRVRDLLDSLYRGYPSGAILLWDTAEPVAERDFAVGQKRAPVGGSRLLLDGQQRLTSLSAVIRGEPVTVRNRKKPIELLFNLEHPDMLSVVTEVDEDGDDDDDEEGADDDAADAGTDELLERFARMTFVVSTKKLENLPHWVRVSEVFKSDGDADFLERAGIEKFSDPRFKKYSERLARLRGIRKYVYRMDVLERTLTYEEVTEIFVRVNSLGAKLRSSDLALAQITARWSGALEIFLAFQKECEHEGFALELGLFLKNMIAFATGQSRFRTVGSLGLEKLQTAWKESVPGMQFALNFLASNAGIKSPALLSSPFILVALALFGHLRKYRLTQAEAKSLRRWVLLANAKGRYSRGSSETLLDTDLGVLRNGGGPAELMERLQLQVGRIDIAPAELEGRNRRSALFKTMFLAFEGAGAVDWHSKLAIAIDHRGAQHKLQFHHIFPKALLRDRYSAQEINDIANLAFIGGATNRRINDTAPSQYVPAIVARDGSTAFASQCIPTDAPLLDVGAYTAFLSARRQLIAERLNAYLGVDG